MKQHLLTLPIAFLSVTASMAQTSFDSAIQAKPGENKYTVEGETSQTVYWTFTADKNYIAKTAPLAGTSNTPTVGTLSEDPSTHEQQLVGMASAGMGNNNYAYPLKKGNTYYFSSTNLGATGFNLTLEENDYIDGGLDNEAPTPIVDGKDFYLGNPNSTSYSNYYVYATYTATENAQLQLTSYSYLSATVGGVSYNAEYADGKYVLKMGVTSGETYKLIFSISQPAIVSAQLNHPKEGSLDMPFQIVEGDNRVPADYGEYYYTYTPTKTGYMTITSDDYVPGCVTTVYNSKYDITYNNPAAKAESGKFNVRVEVPYVGSTYYIVVSKQDGTDEGETFHFAMEEYKAGETEGNPIMLDQLPATQTLAAAKGTFYYGIKVPANTDRLLTVQAAKTVGSATSVRVYPQYDQYSGVYGTGSVECNVNNTYDRTYIIRWTADESEPLTFTADLRTVEAGDLITNPKEAVAGENTLTGNGTKYYTYTATRSGKLTVEGSDPEMTISFPRDASGWSGDITPIVDGIKYSLEAVQGKLYYIKLQNCKAGETFTVTESDFGEGEVRETAIAVEGSEYVLGAKQNNVWLKYTAKSNCQLSIKFDNAEGDAEVDNSNTVEYGKENEYMSGMATSIMDGSTAVNKYYGTKVLNAGESVLVHISMKTNVEGWKLTFEEGEVPQGMSVDNPYVLKAGESVEIQPSSVFWVKADLTKGDNVFVANDNNRTYLYGSLEDAEAQRNETYVSYNVVWSDDYTSLTATFIKNVDEPQTVYFQFMGVSSAFTFKFESEGTPTAISGINADADASAEVYSINGAKVAGDTRSLGKGVYVIRQGGKAKKIIIK